MIGEFGIDIAFGVLTKFLALFNAGNIQWNVQSSSFTPFFDIVRSICYFLPVKTIVEIISVIFALCLLRIAIRVVKTIWDLLPIL